MPTESVELLTHRSSSLAATPQVRAVIPRRSTLAGDRGVLIVNYAMHKQKTLFFFLLQARALEALDQHLRHSQWPQTGSQTAAHGPERKLC